MNYITLSNGVKMPQLGYGVYQVTKAECERCVSDALKVGYRLIDTAQSYFNEEEVGNAVAKSGIPREEIFLTTKVWIEHYGYEETRASVAESMLKLQTDYLDLCLLHQPFGDTYGAYRALEDLYDEGKIRAIGISNFGADRRQARINPNLFFTYGKNLRPEKSVFLSGFLCGGCSKAFALQRRQVKIRLKSAFPGRFGLFSLA